MSQPVYAPPPGSPPHFHPPPGPPPPASTNAMQPSRDPPLAAQLQTQADITPPNSDPPPAYTRHTADPLPAWSSIDFTDLTDSENPSDLSTRLPLDPPPSCFSTPSPPRIRTRSFEPFHIPSRDQSLLGGFRLLYPRGLLSPHGITQEDWMRFLHDLGLAARLSARGFGIRGEVQPPPHARAGFIRGRTGTAYDASFGKTPVEEVQGLIQVWNESALERRKVRVTLRPVNDVQARRREAYELLVEAL